MNRIQIRAPHNSSVGPARKDLVALTNPEALTNPDAGRIPVYPASRFARLVPRSGTAVIYAIAAIVDMESPLDEAAIAEGIIPRGESLPAEAGDVVRGVLKNIPVSDPAPEIQSGLPAHNLRHLLGAERERAGTPHSLGRHIVRTGIGYSNIRQLIVRIHRAIETPPIKVLADIQGRCGSGILPLHPEVKVSLGALSPNGDLNVGGEYEGALKLDQRIFRDVGAPPRDSDLLFSGKEQPFRRVSERPREPGDGERGSGHHQAVMPVNQAEKSGERPVSYRLGQAVVFFSTPGGLL